MECVTIQHKFDYGFPLSRPLYMLAESTRYLFHSSRVETTLVSFKSNTDFGSSAYAHFPPV